MRPAAELAKQAYLSLPYADIVRFLATSPPESGSPGLAKALVLAVMAADGVQPASVLDLSPDDPVGGAVCSGRGSMACSDCSRASGPNNSGGQ